MHVITMASLLQRPFPPQLALSAPVQFCGFVSTGVSGLAVQFPVQPTTGPVTGGRGGGALGESPEGPRAKTCRPLPPSFVERQQEHQLPRASTAAADEDDTNNKDSDSDGESDAIPFACASIFYPSMTMTAH